MRNTLPPMILLLGSLFLLWHSGASCEAPAFPPTIGLLFPQAHVGLDEKPPTFLPLGFWVDGEWDAETYITTALTRYDAKENKAYGHETTEQERKHIASMLKQTFYATYDTEARFMPEKPVVFWVIAAQYFALEGRLLGLTVEKSETYPPPIVMCGQPRKTPRPVVVERVPNKESLFSLMLAAASDAETQFLAELAEDGWSVRNYRGKEPRFTPALYGKPYVVEALRFELAKDRTALWVRMKRDYPKEATPVIDTIFVEPLWEEEYRAIVEVVDGTRHEALWQNLCIIRDNFGADSYKFIGVGDGNGDGINEVVLSHCAHEYRAYQLFALSEGKFVKVSDLSGAL